MDRQAVWWLTGIGLIFGVLVMRDSIAQRVAKAKTHQNVQAFLAMIRRFESNGNYYTVYGGRIFTDVSQHPNIRTPFLNPRTGRNDYSTAAGAYQITYPTWLTIQTVAFLPDFTRDSQDTAAIWLLQLRGALDYVIAGDFDNAIRVASKTWASLPGSESMQKQTTRTLAQNVYTQNGGQIA